MKKILTLFTALLVLGSITVVKADTWTVAGSDATLLGASWSQTSTANDMINVSGNDWYLLKANKTLTSGTLEYKVCKDHEWNTAYPGSNQQFSLTSGTYDVLFKFVNDNNHSVSAVKVTSWTVAGSETVMGSDWSTTDTNNDMVRSGNNWTLTKNHVLLAVGTTYQCKVAANHAWTYAFPASNKDFSVAEDGYYDVTINFNTSTLAVTVTTTFIEPAVPPTPTISLHSNITGSWATSDNFDIEQGDATATLTISNVAVGGYELGVKINNEWTSNGAGFTRANNSYAVTSGSGNCTFVADIAGDYTFTWTYETNTLAITYPDMVTKEVKFFAPRTEFNHWDNVYAFVWNGTVVYSADFPGDEITSTKNSGWYKCDVPVGASVIFSDGAGMQTQNIENVQADVCYVPTAINEKVTVAEQCTVDYYISGTKELTGLESDWVAADANLKLDANNQITFENLAAGTYEFKITNGTWAWSIGGGDHLDGECATIATTNGIGNVEFTIASVQDVTITYHPETERICLGAVTVQTPGNVTFNNINIKIGEAKQIKYTKNNTETYGASYEILSGEEYIQIYNGFVLGVKAGTATVRGTIAETANYTAASNEFTVTVSASSEPAVEPIAPIGGKFIINANGDTAIFARGNLQYQQSTNTWRCAPNQYEWKGMSNIQMGNAEYEGWVDLFCWSIGAENNYGATSNYQKATYFNKEFVDWGTLFGDEWSTLSKDELNYLLNSRPGANSKWAVAMIGDTLGMMLLPDVWEAPAGIAYVTGTNSLPTTELWRDEDCIQDIAPEEIEDLGYQYRLQKENLPANKFTLEQWAALETAGAVFLPFAGRRTGGVGNYLDYDEATHPNMKWQLYYENYQGTYWTSTMYNASKGQPYYYYSFKYSKQGNEELYDWGKGVLWSENGRFGQSVRLVKRIPKVDYTRDVTAGNYGTICLPQAGTIAGATLYSIGSYDGSMIYVDEVGTTLAAGVPYIFYATANQLKVSYTSATQVAAGEANGLHGFYDLSNPAATFDIPENAGNYVLYQNQYWLVSGRAAYIANYRAYIKTGEINNAQPAPGIRRVAMQVNGQNTTTGVDQITNDQSPITNKVIIDGRLFILRGEKMYDATGRLVK